MRILEVSNRGELEKIMQDIRVDRYGIDIMCPKALTYLIKINNLSNITANILKQEMLSLGADAAVARGALTGKTKKTDCLLMGSISQFNRLNNKLKLQPFGLDKLAGELSRNLKNYKRENFNLDLGKSKFKLGQRKFIMGIVNLTPDSFSGDGLYKNQEAGSKRQDSEYIVDYVGQMVRDGADIIDVGGESSRPGAKPVGLKEELNRTIPIIKKITKRVRVPISIDTYKPQVAKAALDCGVNIVNSIAGLRNRRLAKLIARYKCAVVIMHMRGIPQNMQNNPVYHYLIDELLGYFRRSIDIALECGIDREKIIIDPGIGFGKSAADNLAILKSLKEFRILGRPILVGASRKSFIGKVLNRSVDKRLSGTIASCMLAAVNGADILRGHDVGEIKQALMMFEAIMRA